MNFSVKNLVAVSAMAIVGIILFKVVANKLNIAAIKSVANAV